MAAADELRPEAPQPVAINAMAAARATASTDFAFFMCLTIPLTFPLRSSTSTAKSENKIKKHKEIQEVPVRLCTSGEIIVLLPANEKTRTLTNMEFL